VSPICSVISTTKIDFPTKGEECISWDFLYTCTNINGVRFGSVVVRIDDGVGYGVRVTFPKEVAVMEVIGFPSELYLIASDPAEE
jgi:hypothetical protein